MPKHTVDLGDILPRAGMINAKPFLSSARRDHQLLKQLRFADVVGKSVKKRREHRKLLDEALTGMLTTAALLAGEKTDDEEEVVPFLTFVEEVQARTPWASKMSASVFLDLFAAVLGARVAWKQNPREPFAPEEHCTTATAAQQLLDSAPAL